MSSQSPSYRPSNETSSQIWLDEAILDGNHVGYIAYGVHATLFFLCLNSLWAKRRSNPRHSYTFIAYISLLFALGTVGVGTQLHFDQVAFVDERAFPEGPGTYGHTHDFVPYNIAGTAAYIINSWMQDGLLLYRFYIIWDSNWRIVIIPALNFVTTIIISCILIAQLALPGRSLWQSSSANLALTYWSTSIATTMLLTILIVGRLLYLRHEVHTLIGRKHSQIPYLSVSAMLIESACLYSVWALIFIITYARNNTVNDLVFQSLGQVQSIAPLLILLRVAQGRGWTRNTMNDTMGSGTLPRSGIHFTPKSVLDSEGINECLPESSTFAASATKVTAPSQSVIISKVGDNSDLVL